MSKVLKESEVADYLPESLTKGRWYIFCPGCHQATQERHPEQSELYWINSALHCFAEDVHQFNGDLKSPTLSPSLLMKYTEYESGKQYCCHSFVRNGKIEFLGDCTHPLKGQTVDLMDAQIYLDIYKKPKE